VSVRPAVLLPGASCTPAPFTALPDATALQPNTHEGLNSLNATGYHGPCPPRGKHHYVFTLYALDAMLNIASAPTTTQLRTAMESHVLGQATLTGLREKQKPDIVNARASRPK
jgi:Raf kinase inhibitor-like YbhB/YbcL family protein